jgi:hypothetical protein
MIELGRIVRDLAGGMMALRTGVWAPAAVLGAIAAFLMFRKFGMVPESPASTNRGCSEMLEAKALAGLERQVAAIEVLTPAVLTQRVRDAFPGTYLTVLAIIQGVSLGVLLTIGQQQWLRHATVVERVMVATQSASVFVAIIVVTHRYLLLTVLTRWMPQVWDTIFPYALGVGEIGAALLIGDAIAWWTSVLFFALAGVGAFLYSRMQVSRQGFGAMVHLYKQFRRITLFAIIALLISAALAIVLIVLGAYSLGSLWLYALTPLLFTVLVGSIEIYGTYGFEDQSR